MNRNKSPIRFLHQNKDCNNDFSDLPKIKPSILKACPLKIDRDVSYINKQKEELFNNFKTEKIVRNLNIIRNFVGDIPKKIKVIQKNEHSYINTNAVIDSKCDESFGNATYLNAPLPNKFVPKFRLNSKPRSSNVVHETAIINQISQVKQVNTEQPKSCLN